MWIKGKAYYEGEIKEICINFDRSIKEIRANCKPDMTFTNEELILPASVDLHVHVRGAQLSYKETVATATSEAVYGGVGVIVDMPNTVPYINTPERIKERLREFQLYSRTDYGIYSGVSKEVEEIDKLPIAGYKIYPEDLEKEETRYVLEKSKKLKILHPEMPFVSKIERSLRRSYWMETAAINLVKGNMHITHITNFETLQLAKSMGFTTDITAHHLVVDGERDCISKVNPPIRDYVTRLKLFLKGLFEVDCIASDHAPHSKEEKRMNFDLCPPGIAGVSFSTPYIYSLMFKGLISIDRAVSLLSGNPSRILNIPTGKIKEGYRANFTVIKRENWRYTTKFSKVTETPMDGFSLDAKVTNVIVEGKLAFDGENVYPIRGVNIFDSSSRS
ncbi:dihydroorotase [Sulfolobus acidocaldarius]|uniref:Dihydroorotase n=4 Tax=Sulfolobus acidocaldarius TaxID=2285 RepID=PYRC_SULAC|nr:dihydroorotase [Sulfolobus acidocaldarius]O08357.2 RecName: Full=Dihydroorotase; Short=DHOase [Sulfolobus acidocaldarius DSM 639]AAY80906.1 dihydroorotase [Sulfolobus acidocaldarius DSM 639]AGE71506.1 dihydroorotase [Sulfolobus acidocaldarius N8]AGE73779.1 dihydroorotase [Sulfolobus acidocaldarius Ron12/I]ALU30262.1 dihydroorotase [Sulfolobus acidocaldarius]ALU30978.1 dihydroorotase [Sulfolobus acidocaldarius]